MNWTLEEIYKLLPAVYRLRDAESGYPLKALLAVIAEQAGVMEEDITGLYENWFIETCDEWTVPYIGDMLGVRGLNRVGNDAVFSQRARVGNMLGYRRRKGTPAMLEQLSRDTTGWNTRVVEFFELLIATQHYNHIRLHCSQTPDLRRTNDLELLDTAFDSFAHSVDVRRIALNRGRHNIPNIGLFLWQLQSYFLQRCSARAAVEPNAGPAGGRYYFSQIGQNMPLFNRPQTEESVTHLAEEINVPGLVRRRPLYDELEARRQELADKQNPLFAALANLRQDIIEANPLTASLNALSAEISSGSSALFDELDDLIDKLTLGTMPHETGLAILHKAMLAVSGVAAVYFGQQPVLQVFVQPKPNAPFYELLPEEILICNLSGPPSPIPEEWMRPLASKIYPSTIDSTKKLEFKNLVAVDPVLGRLAFPKNFLPSAVDVSYAYGFSGDVGGGPYDRRESVASVLEPKNALRLNIGWQAGVSKSATPIGSEKIFDSLAAAMADWNTPPKKDTVGILTLMDNHTYNEDLTAANKIQIPEGSLLLIVAADWPVLDEPDPSGSGTTKVRRNGRITPTESRAHLRGSVVVKGTASASSPNPGTLVIDGLLIEGGIDIAPGNLGRLRLAHSTLVPLKGGLTATTQNGELQVDLEGSISGRIKLTPPIGGLRIVRSVVDFASGVAVAAGQTDAKFENSTVLGKTETRSLEAGNSIFTGQITVTRRQEGCVRFSYVPADSSTPRRFRCQPDLALTGVTDPDEQAAIIARMNPSFTSEKYFHFGYCQLNRACVEEIRTGADDGSELGVFNFLKNPQRETNLQASLDEFLRFGLEAGIIPASLKTG